MLADKGIAETSSAAARETGDGPLEFVETLDAIGAGPRRQCVLCRRRAGKEALLKIVRRPEGGVRVAEHKGAGWGPGRSAYLCREGGCSSTSSGQALDPSPEALRRIERALGVRLSAAERQLLETAVQGLRRMRKKGS